MGWCSTAAWTSCNSVEIKGKQRLLNAEKAVDEFQHNMSLVVV